MLKYKIIRYKFSWNVLVYDRPAKHVYWDSDLNAQDYPKSVKAIRKAIKRNRLPYVKGSDYFYQYGTAITGGPYMRITLSPLVEEEDLVELEKLIDDAINDNIIATTKHRKKLITFLPPRLKWSN